MVKIASTSSVHLHQMLVTTTFNAPISYLSSVDNSVTLNRFSQDMMLVETTLPVMTYVLLQST
jgi:ATP-binding cassette subfamily C (CFTR/MRP) protein 1